MHGQTHSQQQKFLKWGTHKLSHLLRSVASCFLDLLLAKPRKVEIKCAAFDFSSAGMMLPCEMKKAQNQRTHSQLATGMMVWLSIIVVTTVQCKSKQAYIHDSSDQGVMTHDSQSPRIVIILSSSRLLQTVFRNLRCLSSLGQLSLSSTFQLVPCSLPRVERSHVQACCPPEEHQ
jgi:hypothetical protein